MKFSRKSTSKLGLSVAAICLISVAFGVMLLADSAPDWIQNIEARSALEAVMYRVASLPSGPITIRRPPSETVPAFAALIKQQPDRADLYSLKAMEEEANLNFDAAESDWKIYLQHATDKTAAQLALADFYHRRHRPKDEVAALAVIGNMPLPPSEKLVGITDQRSWRAFERSLAVIDS